MRFTKLLSQKNSDYHSYASVNAVFLGDSVTHGCFEIVDGVRRNIDVVCDHEAVYHAQLKRMLNCVFPAAPINMINSGISGGNAPGGFARLKRDVLRYSPDLVVICFGLNDACNGPDKVHVYYKALLDIFKVLKDNSIETIFMTPNMMNTYISPHITGQKFIDMAQKCAEVQNSGTLDTYMEYAKKACSEAGIPVCDCYAKWKKLFEAGVDTTALLSNYINHPSREMHKLFAGSLFDMIMFG